MHGALEFLITETFKVKCLNRVTTSKRDPFAESKVPMYGVHAKMFGRRQDSAFQDEEERLLVSAQGDHCTRFWRNLFANRRHEVDERH